MKKALPFLILSLYIAAGCGNTEHSPSADFKTVQDSSHIVFSIYGLDGPEAVRFDPDQKVYFISNFTGGGNTQDSTGFITRADAEGNILELKFMTGTEKAPLHAPRGMFITGETLWAADVLGLHGFNRNSGEQSHFIDFSAFDIGFLNDVVADAQGTLYITDTGNPRVYKVQDDEVTVFIDSLPEAPNGITLNPATNSFVLAPWGGDQTFRSFSSEEDLQVFGELKGGYFDGIEFLHDHLLVASQQDSSIRVYSHKGNNSKSTILIHTAGRPADIGINSHLNHVAVPYIALDRVDVWNLSQH